MSFREIAVTIRAVNRASNEFSKIQTDAETLATRVKSLGSTLAGLGAAGTAIGYVANQFGLLNDSEMKVFNSAMMVVSVMGLFLRTSTGLVVAQKVYSAACWVATAAQNALNISYGTFLALTGVGIAVIVAAAAAMAYFASSMNTATASVQNFNTATAETPTHTRSIQRAGESAVTSRSGSGGSSEASFYRRGVEQ
ncbi:MAG: hypothetical protein NWF01_07060 [Candidatus Bathyarchaeota archaeon]|nr:hypothetical protein [Candidatus Bathyarchaeota archaeon]